MIKVGVDARHLSGRKNGIQTYLQNLLHYAIRITTDTHKWYLYCPYRMDKSGLEYDNVVIVTTSVPTSLRGFDLLFLHLCIPILAVFNKVDLMWFPANRSSAFLPGRIAQVLSIHDLVWKKYPETMTYFGWVLDKTFMTRSAFRADIISTVSQFSFDEAVSAGVAKGEKIVVIPNGVKRTQTIKNGPFVSEFCLFVGTVEPRKNLMRLLQAYGSLSPKIRDSVRLLIVGGKGWGNVNLNKMIVHLDLVDNVDVLGSVDEETLEMLYSNAQFLVMPSLYEGFGLPLIEAMSYGTPVLTANNSSMPEVAGDAGLLVDALDVKSIADGLLTMITNEELRDRLGKNSMVQASKFSWEESASKLVDAFERAIRLKN